MFGPPTTGPMSTFFTADFHFDHWNPQTGGILHHCRRPWSDIETMNEALVENFNALVGPKDLTYILGDFAWRRHRHFVSRLRGKKVLVRGNHDKIDRLTAAQFSEVVGTNKRPGILELTLDKHLVVLCHYPMDAWRGSPHGSWHLYGHSHGRTKEYETRLRCDVGLDVWDYMPVPWEVLKLKLEERGKPWQARRKEVYGRDDYDYDEALAPLRTSNRGVYERCMAAGAVPAGISSAYTKRRLNEEGKRNQRLRTQESVEEGQDPRRSAEEHEGTAGPGTEGCGE